MAENKMEQVAAKNNFDKLLGKNGELVEERKKQVLVGALEIVQRHCDETPNKMEVVAALFGKKLGEHFCVSCCNTRFLLKFTSDGLWVFDDSWGHWNDEDGMLEDLLTGQAVIVDDRE